MSNEQSCVKNTKHCMCASYSRVKYCECFNQTINIHWLNAYSGFESRLLLPGCVTLGKLPILCLPQCPYLLKKRVKSQFLPHRVVMRTKRVDIFECLKKASTLVHILSKKIFSQQ